MSYTRLPAQFVANDYLCAFLLANGCRELTTDRPLASAMNPPTTRYFEHDQTRTYFEVDPARALLNVAGPGFDRRLLVLPAAALVLLLTADLHTSAGQQLFNGLLGVAAPRRDPQFPAGCLATVPGPGTDSPPPLSALAEFAQGPPPAAPTA